jgi:hypothetical protein
MKRTITLLSFILIAAFAPLFGQTESDLYTPVRSSFNFEGADVAAELEGKIKPSVSLPTNPNTPEAMFDVQFILRPNDSLGAGIAKRTYGVLWTGTEFWMAQWTSDSIARFSQSGRLLGYLRTPNLPATTGNTGIRGFTMEGTNIWATNTSNFLMRLDRTTGEILENVAIPAVIAGVRFATWDPTEGGGFWVGNTSTDLYKVSKSGAIIRTIPRATHGLIFMTGAAYDSVSVGGPYLWVNCQIDFATTGNNSAFVRQVQLSSGFGTNVIRELKTDIPTLNANFAGAATIAMLPGLTKPSLIMGAQNTTANSGAVIGYELNFAKPNSVDMGLDSLSLTNGFTVMPLRHRNPAAMTIKARNIGFAPITGGTVSIDLLRNDIDLVYDKTVPTTAPALAFQSFSVGSDYKPTLTGNYTGYAYAAAIGDANRYNDTASVYFAISDSTYATDNVQAPNASIIALSIAGTVATPGQKRLGMSYRLPVASTVNSVSINFRPNLTGDSFQIKVYKVVNGIPSDSIASSPVYITTTADVLATPVVRTLQLTKPLNVAANEEFVICLTEGRGSMRLSSTTRGYRPKTTWAYGTFWINTDTFSNANFRSALYLRPNINIRVGSAEINSNISTVKAFPNPVSNTLNVSVQLKEMDKATIALYDVTGHLLFQDKTADTQSFTKNYPLSNLPSGMYILTVTTGKGTWQEKVFKE